MRCLNSEPRPVRRRVGVVTSGTRSPVLRKNIALCRMAVMYAELGTEVEVGIGSREGVLAIPNSALRTDADVASAAMVLGLDPDAVREQVAAARRAGSEPRGGAPANGESTETGETPTGETVNMMGREVPVPEGHTAAEVEAVFNKMRSGGGPQSLNAQEQALLQKMRGSGGGMGGGRDNRRSADESTVLFGGEYVVFVLRSGVPTPVPVKTGLTDLDYSEVVNGLTLADTVLIMPSASLLASQQAFQDRVQSRVGGVMPGGRR